MPRRRLADLLFVGAFFGLLALPALTHDGASDPGIETTEQRRPAPLPVLPDSWPALLAWPKQEDAYLADHFGGRTDMVLAFNRARYALFGETPTEQTVFGPQGRLFLTSHSAERPYELIAAICNIWVGDAQLDRVVRDLDGFRRQAEGWSTDSYLMIVPSAPSLYPGDLPAWAQPQCAVTPIVDRILARLPQGELSRRLIYPRQAMLAAEAQGWMIPPTHFHWQGLGPATAMRAFAEGSLGLTRHLSMALTAVTEPSDIARMVPGIPTESAVLRPDPEAVGVEYCQGPGCFPELGPAAATIGDLSRLHSPQAGERRLLILSDSFGAAIVPWAAAYFGTVWQFSLNDVGRLSSDDRAAFRRLVFQEYRPDTVLYLCHDGAAQYWPTLVAAPALWGP